MKEPVYEYDFGKRFVPLQEIQDIEGALSALADVDRYIFAGLTLDEMNRLEDYHADVLEIFNILKIYGEHDDVPDPYPVWRHRGDWLESDEEEEQEDHNNGDV
mgnify:CR=1 FL=1